MDVLTSLGATEPLPLAGSLDEVKVVLPASPDALCRQVQPGRWPFPGSQITTGGRANRAGIIVIALSPMDMTAGVAARSAESSVRSHSRKLVACPCSGRKKRVDSRIVDSDSSTGIRTLTVATAMSITRNDGGDRSESFTRNFMRIEGHVGATMLLPLHFPRSVIEACAINVARASAEQIDGPTEPMMRIGPMTFTNMTWFIMFMGIAAAYRS